jgi:hypothetical protein
MIDLPITPKSGIYDVYRHGDADTEHNAPVSPKQSTIPVVNEQIEFQSALSHLLYLLRIHLKSVNTSNLREEQIVAFARRHCTLRLDLYCGCGKTQFIADTATKGDLIVVPALADRGYWNRLDLTSDTIANLRFRLVKYPSYRQGTPVPHIWVDGASGIKAEDIDFLYEEFSSTIPTLFILLG